VSVTKTAGLKVLRRLPTPIIRAVGSLAGRKGLGGLLDHTARSLVEGEGVIARGENAGLRFDGGRGPAGFVLGTWEVQTQRALSDLIAAGDVVYDIGAASGFYVLLAARRAGPAGCVVAFEPVPRNAELIRANVARNQLHNVTVLETAVAAKPGRAFMVDAEDAGVSVEMVPESDGGVEVAVTTVDEVVFDRGLPPPDVIQMDVEGAEIEVLAGALKTLARYRPKLLIEVHERWVEFDEAIRSIGYTYRGIEYEVPADAGRATHVIAIPTISSEPPA
jgi:FkbM family methyltransferase